MEASSEADEICTSAVKVCSNEDLLSKILAGLPLSSLLLSKSVCKRWLSLITDPCFNRLRSRSPNADHPSGLFLQSRTGFSEFAYVSLSNRLLRPLLTITSFPFYPTATTSELSPFIVVLQSCNGLLLCHDFPDNLYVYNPTINYCKLLPLPHTWKAKRFLQDMAIGFDPRVSPHYKVLYLRDDYYDHSDDVQLEIYSSETGTWRLYPQIFNLDSFLMLGTSKVLVYWHDAIHWNDSRQLYHFSLDTENPHFIQVENQIGSTPYMAADKLLVSSCDCLLFAKMESCFHMNVYELKNNDYYSGWSIKYHVNFERATNLTLLPEGPWPGFKVLSVGLGDDPFLVLVVTGVVVLRYNIVSNTFCELYDLTQIGHRHTNFSSFLYTPCLVGVSVN